MTSFHINKKIRYLMLVGILILITTFTILFARKDIPPRDIPDNLDVLYLDTNTNLAPTFRLQSQQTLDINDPLALITGSDLSPIESEPVESDRSDLSLLDSLLQMESDLSPIEPLHLAIHVDSTSQINDTMLQVLTKLNNLVSSMTLSLLPESIDELTYIKFGTDLHDALQSSDLDNIQLIWYPMSTKDFSSYPTELIHNIGISIQSYDDINKVEKLYAQFANTATLYIRDNILGSCDDAAIKLAKKEINSTYYHLAAKYPKINTIFSPYMVNKAFPQDPYYLDSSSESYYGLYTLYKKLADKPWLTTSFTDEITDCSHYKVLNSYDEINGVVEIIMNPDAPVLTKASYKKKYGDSKLLVKYKIDTKALDTKNTYPYVTTIDTSELTDGVSRLKASITVEDTEELIASQSLEITINNPSTAVRSQRITPNYPTDSKVEYGNTYIPVLMYHSILDTVSESEQNSCVEIDVFDSQIKGLLDAGYTPISFKELKDYLDSETPLPKKPIIITMDDGYLNNYENAYPIYQKYNVQATLFVSPYYMTEENIDGHFGWAAAREMEASGLIDIQSHGYNHTPFPYISLKDLRYHISQSFGLIEKNLGPRDVYVVACPQFRNTPSTRKLLTSLGIDFQMTKLAKPGTGLTASNFKRINVPNTMSSDELIEKLESLTH